MLNKPFLMFTTVLLFFVIVSLPVSLANPIPAASTTDDNDVLIGKVSRAVKLMSRKRAPKTNVTNQPHHKARDPPWLSPTIGNPSGPRPAIGKPSGPHQPGGGNLPHAHKDSNKRTSREDRFNRRRTPQ